MATQWARIRRSLATAPIAFAIFAASCAEVVSSNPAPTASGPSVSTRPILHEGELFLIVEAYLRTTKHWQRDDYRLEYRRSENGRDVVWAVYLDEERRVRKSAAAGLVDLGMKESVEIHIDPLRKAVVQELGFQ